MPNHQMMILTRSAQGDQIGFVELERWEQMERFDVMHIQDRAPASQRVQNRWSHQAAGGARRMSLQEPVFQRRPRSRAGYDGWVGHRAGITRIPGGRLATIAAPVFTGSNIAPLVGIAWVTICAAAEVIVWT